MGRLHGWPAPTPDGEMLNISAAVRSSGACSGEGAEAAGAGADTFATFSSFSRICCAIVSSSSVWPFLM
jgi:hypothetical protein